MNRREFLLGVGLLGVGSLALSSRSLRAATLCDGDANVPLEAQIGRNHGHRLLVSRQDVLDGLDKSYDIQGASGHGHIVIVTQELFAELRSQGTVQMVSSDVAGHTHVVTLVCA